MEATRKIGQNRGKPRLWLEGKILTDAGFAHGDRWDLLHRSERAAEGGGHKRDGFWIERNPSGTRKIAGTAERPIIDMAGASLGDCQEAETVSLNFEPGSGMILVTPISWRA